MLRLNLRAKSHYRIYYTIVSTLKQLLIVNFRKTLAKLTFLLYNYLRIKLFVVIATERRYMSHINIVLCEPEIPQNTGNIARTCAATGASLHLIRPLGFEIDNAKLKRAGLDYWDKLDITYYNGLADFYEKHLNETVYYFSTKAKHNYSDVKYEGNVWIMFGKETKGLPEELLHDNPDTTVRIPMRDHLRSLNLSNSVAIAIYEILRQWNFEGMQECGELTKYTWD